MPITPLPTPPDRDDAANFSARADDFLGALPTFAVEANALATEVNDNAIAAAASASTATTKAGEAVDSASDAAASAAAAATFDPANFVPKAGGGFTDDIGIGTETPSSRLDVEDATSDNQLTLTGNGIKTRLFQKKITTSSSTPVTLDIATGYTNALFVVQVDVMSYTGGATYYASAIGRGYLFPSGFGITTSDDISASGLTISLSYVSATTLRVTINDSVSTTTKAGVVRVLVTAASGT